mmetsp:Transcript_30972/g.35794  ORF Transcript_30972/g.35794 Transcript_30972/m.35794 type:complete len:256 (+) Transcript_30972:427-1194(+)
MPWLDLSIRDVKDTVLEGEVCRWTLKLTNRGSAPATNIYLKTNLPWLSLELDTPPSDIPDQHEAGGENTGTNEYEATSYCVGPSGSLMQIPIERLMMNRETMVVNPGETLEISIRARIDSSAPGVGVGVGVGGAVNGPGVVSATHKMGVSGIKRQLYMLVRYDKQPNRVSEESDESRNNRGTESTSTTKIRFDEAKKTPPKPEYRFVKKVVEFTVYPSFTLSASVMPSYWNKTEHILSIEKRNFTAATTAARKHP